MDTVWFNMAVSVVLGALAQIKGAKKKAEMKKVCLKIFNNIKTLYSDDPDFQ